MRIGRETLLFDSSLDKLNQYVGIFTATIAVRGVYPELVEGSLTCTFCNSIQHLKVSLQNTSFFIGRIRCFVSQRDKQDNYRFIKL